MTSTKNQRRTNGHAGPQDPPNGHAPASTEGCGVSLPARPCTSLPVRQAGGRPAAGRQPGLAASDDASGRNVASAAANDATAGTIRGNAYAEVAPHPPAENPKPEEPQIDKSDLRLAILAGPTEPNAMQDGSAYVEAVGARVDFVAASIRLLCSEDEKIAKAELDRLREMKFGKVGPALGATEAQTVVWDIPGVSPLKDER